MIELKGDFSGGLNLDDSPYALPKNCYVDAQNITRDAIAGSNDRAITNVFGNRPILISSSTSYIQNGLQKWYEYTVEITNPGYISAGTRTVINLNEISPTPLGPQVVCDFTSTVNQPVVDYCNQVVASFYTSIITASFSSFNGTIANGTYTVSPSSTSGVGSGSIFDLTFSGNVLTTIKVVFGGTNYAKPPSGPGDIITFKGSLFGGIDGVDDVSLQVSSIGLPSGILFVSSLGNTFSFRFNYGSPLPILRWAYSGYTISLGHQTSGYTCIGAYPNTVRNTVIYFLYNNLGYHMILEFNVLTEITIKILENLVDTGGIDILNFDLLKKICNVNIFNRDEGDLLYFLDTLGRPTGLDIEKFKTGEYTPVTRDIIDVCKRPPLGPPYCQYGNDTTKKSNNLRGRFFRFKYRYIYDDLSKSVCSPISKLTIPTDILNYEKTNVSSNNNYLRLQFITGEKDVKEIELLMSYVDKTNDWSDFQVIDTLPKEIKYSTYVTLNSATEEVTRINFSGSPITYANVKIYYELAGTPYVITSSVVQPGWTIQDLVNDLQANYPTGSVVSGSSSLVITVDPSIAGNFSNVQIDYQAGIDNLNIVYLFYNDSVYPNIDIQESIQLYDYVPRFANAQELANGNVLVYGGITEGYDKILSPNVEVKTLTTPAGPGNSAYGAFKISATDIKIQTGLTNRNAIKYYFYGLPPRGTTITIYVKKAGNDYQLLPTYTTTDNDTLLSICQNIFNSGFLVSTYAPNTGPLNQFTIFGGLVGYQVGFLYNDPYVHSKIEIVYPNAAVTDNPVPTFLFNTERNIGIAYFDKKGVTNGIIWNQKVSTPSYTENNLGQVNLPYFNLKIFHKPPEWAFSYQFYFTQESTQFLYWYGTINTTDANYIFIDISLLEKQQQLFPTTTAVCSWSFQDGDRLRIIKNLTTAPYSIFPDTYDTEIIGIVKDPIINGTQVSDKTFIKVPRKGAFNTLNTFDQTSFYMIQMYRNSKVNNDKIYYEFGEQYYIENPGQNERRHFGMITDQDFVLGLPAEFNFYYGDVYLRERKVVAGTAPGFYSTFNYYPLDRNITDNYISAVNSISGRPNTIDVNAKNAYYSTFVRFGQAYQPNTNINGIPRFYALNFDEYDYNYGDIMRFKTRDRFIRVFQKLKVGMVPLYQQMVKNQDSQTLVISDKLLNPIQYYQGDVGIGDNPESLASFNYADYFTSNIKGAICRASQDGVDFLSVQNKVNSWANANVGDPNKRFMIGTFDQRLSNYILYLSPTIQSTQSTIVYDQEIGNFETFLTMYPEMMVTIGVVLISFKDGVLYVHNDSPYNTWYQGATNSSLITPVFNDNPYQKKTFLALSEVASQVWEVPYMYTDLNSYGTTKQESNLVASDFAQLEGSFEATIMRDVNSPGGVLSGDTMKGKYLIPTYYIAEPASLVALNIVSLKYIDSPLTTK